MNIMNQVKALSNIDILHKLNDKYHLNVTFVPYSELYQIESIENILPCILLFQLHYKIGHWVCLYRASDGILQYFDPTGFKPDILNEIDFENPLGRQALHADYTYLTRLLFDDVEKQHQSKIVFNEAELQGDSSMTCGYWSSVKLCCQDISNDDFNAIWLTYSLEERERKIVELYEKL